MRKLLVLPLVWVASLPNAAAADGGEWRAVAERALLSALRIEYPHADGWTAEPLIGRRQLQFLEGLRAPAARVTQLGKRSAVHLTDAQARNRATVWFAVTGIESVLVMKIDVKSRAPLSAQLAEHADRDVLAVSCSRLAAPEQLDGMRAKRRIAAGEPVCAEAIEARPAVGRGEQVTVVSVAGAVAITAKGIAQQDASIGQMLRIKNPSSGEVYVAAVRGAGEVIVHE